MKAVLLSLMLCTSALAADPPLTRLTNAVKQHQAAIVLCERTVHTEPARVKCRRAANTQAKAAEVYAMSRHYGVQTNQAAVLAAAKKAREAATAARAAARAVPVPAPVTHP